MTRECQTCHATYRVDDTITRCDREVGGQRCGGQVKPDPPEDQAAKLPYSCLVCCDTGWVKVAGEMEKCRRPHRTAERIGKWRGA